MERVIIEEDEWDQITDVDVVERPIEKITVEEVMAASVPALGQVRPPENFTWGPLYPQVKWKVKVVLHRMRFSSDFAFHAYSYDF